MPLQYTILRDIGVVYTRFSGVVTVQDTEETYLRFTRDPDYHPDLNHLIDLKDLVEYERSYTDLMKLQALQAESVMKARHPVLAVYFAPTRIGRATAHTTMKSWDGLGVIVMRVVQQESEALQLLGLGQHRFADLPMNRA